MQPQKVIHTDNLYTICTRTEKICNKIIIKIIKKQWLNRVIYDKKQQ